MPCYPSAVTQPGCAPGRLRGIC